jgi:penicillin-binding protein 1A
MGFDRPQKIQSNAQGGRLVAPAWTAYMSEIYQRRPAPPDWPRPEGLVTREIDRTDGMLRSPFCPDSLVISEFYIEGTEPVQECNIHGPFGPDSTRAIATPAPFGGQPSDPNAVRPRATPVPTPSRPSRDTVARRTFDPFHPGKP